MKIELLFWAGCPSHPKALADLREAMGELGLDPSTVLVSEVRDEADAERERFVGSPTIRIDERDIEPSQGEPYSLNCRIYHRRDGRISATPDPAEVREALLAAQAKQDDPADSDPAASAGSLSR
jgi:hypothetical protein